MKIELDSKQIEWLRVVVLYRIKDETSELNELIVSGREDAISVCKGRLEMWKSILDALDNKEVES